MLRATSEMAVAMVVRSAVVKPADFGNRRPLRRAATISASVAMACRTDRAPMAADSDARPPYRARRRTRTACYGPGTSFTDHYADALGRHLEHPGEAGLNA